MSIRILKVTAISVNGSFFHHPCIMNTEHTSQNILRINFNTYKRTFLLDFSNLLFLQCLLSTKNASHRTDITIIQLLQNDAKTYIYYKVLCM